MIAAYTFCTFLLFFALTAGFRQERAKKYFAGGGPKTNHGTRDRIFTAYLHNTSIISCHRDVRSEKHVSPRSHWLDRHVTSSTARALQKQTAPSDFKSLSRYFDVIF